MHARQTVLPRSLACVIAFAALAAPVVAFAQNQREYLETVGRVVGMQGAIMQFEARDGVIWQIQVPRADRITYRNTAGPKFLAPGMFVSFNGRFDDRGKMEGMLSSIKIFTPQSPDQLGVFPDVLNNVGNTFNKPEAQADPDDKKPKPYQVSGRIAKVGKTGEITIQAGTQPVTCAVDPKAQIDIEVSALDLMQPGDTVNVDAWYYPQRVGQAVATRMEVIGAKPFGIDPKAGPGGPAVGPALGVPPAPAFTPGFGAPGPNPGTPTPPQPGVPTPTPPQPGTPTPPATGSPFDLK